MAKDIKSYNSSRAETEDLRRVFLPSLLDFSFYIFAGSLVLLLLNTSVIWHYFNNSVPSQESIRDTVSQNLPLVNKLGDAAQGRVFLVLFWMAIGLGVYLLYWFLNSVIINFRNNIVVGHYYLHPSNFNKTGYWLSILKRNLIFSMNVVVLLAYVYAAVRLMLALSKFSGSAFSNFETTHALPKLGLSVLCAAFVLHFFFMLTHITIRSWRHMA